MAKPRPKVQVCTKCRKRQRLDQFYHNSQTGRPRTICKVCFKAEGTRRHKAKLEKFSAANQPRSENTLQEDRAAVKRRTTKHPDHFLEYHESADPQTVAQRRKAYYLANREKIKKRQRAYYQLNREKLRKQQRTYYQQNRERLQAIRRVNYARKKALGQK